MTVTAFHQTEHLTRVAAHLQRFAVEITGEWIERHHDVTNGAVAVIGRVRRLGLLSEVKDAGIGFLDHLLAEIDPHEIVLEDVVVEHVLGGFAKVGDPLRYRWRLDSVGHVLGIDRASGVVVAADPTDAASDEMSVARVLTLHENAVAAENRRRRMALADNTISEINLGVEAETADDTRDRVPIHFNDLRWLSDRTYFRCYCRNHVCLHPRRDSARIKSAGRLIAGRQVRPV